MTAVLKGPDHWTPRRRLFAGQSGQRASGRLPGGHVLDRADLGKAITLCSENGCVRKFDAAKSGYVTKSNLPFVRGRCDGCQRYTNHGHLLVHHTLANLTR